MCVAPPCGPLFFPLKPMATRWKCVFSLSEMAQVPVLPQPPAPPAPQAPQAQQAQEPQQAQQPQPQAANLEVNIRYFSVWVTVVCLYLVLCLALFVILYLSLGLWAN